MKIKVDVVRVMPRTIDQDAKEAGTNTYAYRGMVVEGIDRRARRSAVEESYGGAVISSSLLYHRYYIVVELDQAIARSVPYCAPKEQVIPITRVSYSRA